MRLIVNFQQHRTWNIHAIAEDCRTPLSPYRDVASKETLLRLFRYLGANDSDIAEVETDIRRWGRGGVHLDVPQERLALIGVRP